MWYVIWYTQNEEFRNQYEKKRSHNNLTCLCDWMFQGMKSDMANSSTELHSPSSLLSWQTLEETSPPILQVYQSL